MIPHHVHILPTLSYCAQLASLAPLLTHSHSSFHLKNLTEIPSSQLSSKTTSSKKLCPTYLTSLNPYKILGHSYALQCIHVSIYYGSTYRRIRLAPSHSVQGCVLFALFVSTIPQMGHYTQEMINKYLSNGTDELSC